MKEQPDLSLHILLGPICLNIMVNMVQLNPHSFLASQMSRCIAKVTILYVSPVRAFYSNFGKRPLAKIGKNNLLNIKIGRN